MLSHQDWLRSFHHYAPHALPFVFSPRSNLLVLDVMEFGYTKNYRPHIHANRFCDYSTPLDKSHSSLLRYFVIRFCRS